MSLVRAGLGSDRRSSILGLWAASAGPKTPPTSGPLRGPPAGGVLGPAEAAQTPKIDDFRSAPRPALTKDTLRLGTHIRRSDGCGNTQLGTVCEAWQHLEDEEARKVWQQVEDW